MNTRRPAVSAVVVTYESAAVIERCLNALREAAPGRGIDAWVVDNASTDDGVQRAAAVLGWNHVIRRPTNGGFAAGVNQVLSGFRGEWLAVINPDVVLPPEGIDRLVDFLVRTPRAGLVGPRVDLPGGGREPTAGVFPTPGREWVHAFMLDRFLGLPGRRRTQPAQPSTVDWISGCVWVLRGAAIAATGPLDEKYFMYHEDADYCFRMRQAGWQSWYLPHVRCTHHRGTGSSASSRLPADGGLAAMRLMKRLHPEASARSIQSSFRTGWRLRLSLHKAGARLGRVASRTMALRYQLALEQLRTVGAGQDPGGEA